MPNYSKEQLLQLYKNLPKDLQKAIYSKENADNIQEICTRNGIVKQGRIFDVAKNVAYVFLGLLPPTEFQEVLEIELKLEKNKVERIASEITRFVFLPVKSSLESLYKTEIKQRTKTSLEAPVPTEKKVERKDVYREQIE